MFATAPDLMNIHHLELFYYVVRGGGITSALRLIPYGIQQPAVSAQLSRLEDSLGVKLFQRRPFSLTAAGRAVFEHIAPFFSDLPQVAGRVRQEAVEHLRLAASASVLRQHMPGLLKTIQEQTPGLRITLRESAQESAERMLREHEIDLAVVLLENKPGSGIRHEPLIKISMVLMVELNSPYLTAASVLNALKKESLPLIALPRKEHLPRVFQKKLAERGLNWPTRIEATSNELIETYVSHGFGIGLGLRIPGHSVSPMVRTLPLKGFPTLTFGALWSGRLPAPATSFLQLARARSRELA